MDTVLILLALFSFLVCGQRIYHAGYRAGQVTMPDVAQRIDARTYDINLRKEAVSLPHVMPPVPVPETKLSQAEVSKLLGAEINKGRKGDPDVVERLVELNNRFRKTLS